MDRVLIVGASCRAAAQSAHAAGFEVTALDMFVDRDLQSIANCKQLTQFPESAVRLAKELSPTPIVLAGGMENHPDIVAQLGLRHPLLGATPHQLSCMRDLTNLMQWSSTCDIAFPNTLLPEPRISDTQLSAEPGGTSAIPSPPSPLPEYRARGVSIEVGSKGLQPEYTARGVGFGTGSTGLQIDQGNYVWKPFGSAGGCGIRDLTERKIEDWWQLEETSSLKGYNQKRIEGIPIGVVMICASTDVDIFGISRSLTSNDWPGPSRYIYRGSIAPYALPSSIESKILALGALVRDRLGFRGVLGADFIWQPSSKALWLLELNPRWTASNELHEWSKGRNLFQEHVNACRNQSPPTQVSQVNVLEPPIDRIPVCGKAIVYSTQRFRVSDKHSDHLFEQARQAADVASDCYLADIPIAGVEIQVGSPVLSILASGECPESVARILMSAREQVLGSLEVDG